MRIQHLRKLTVGALATALTFSLSFGQYVGIGEAAPSSKLDVVHAGGTGNSIEISHNGAANGSSALWSKNNGLGRAGNFQNLAAANTSAVVEVAQLGTGNGVSVNMINTANTSPGIQVLQAGVAPGACSGVYIDMEAATVGSPGLAVIQAGTGDAIYTNPTGSGWAQYNVVAGTGGGTWTVLNTDFIADVYDLRTAGGNGGYAFFDGAEGTGYYVDSIGGDGFGFQGLVNTATPTVGNVISGATFAATQRGVGHGILINHYGPQGRNAEFNQRSAANTDPAVFVVNSGHGPAVQAQNQSNAITGIMTVGDFAYTGLDIDDHIGVEGFSAPAVNWGYGVVGSGNWFGVFSNGNSGASGVKSFLIDHPQDPGNKFLRHFSMESDEVLNMYRGNVTLDASGQAVVDLPDYFSAVNIDYSYQLTPIGTSQQPYIAQEISGNHFTVAGAPNSKVSWMVMAQRNDAYIQADPGNFSAVVEKTGSRQGKYLQPELHGQPAEAGMFYKKDRFNAQPTNIASGKKDLNLEGIAQEREELAKKVKSADSSQPEQEVKN